MKQDILTSLVHQHTDRLSTFRKEREEGDNYQRSYQSILSRNRRSTAEVLAPVIETPALPKFGGASDVDAAYDLEKAMEEEGSQFEYKEEEYKVQT